MTRARFLGLLGLACAIVTTSAALDNAGLVKMANAGLSEEIIVSAIKGSSNHTFDTSADGLVALKLAKVPDAAIAAVLATTANPPSAPAAAVNLTATQAPSAPAVAANASKETAPAARDYQLKKGIYFVKEGAKPARATNITPSQVKKPFATLNPNYKVKAFFQGAGATQALKAGDVIVIAGWDVQPQIARFKSENGRRLATLNSSGKLLPEEFVNVSWERDANDNWVTEVPNLPSGEYWVFVDEGEPTPATDFVVR